MRLRSFFYAAVALLPIVTADKLAKLSALQAKSKSSAIRINSAIYDDVTIAPRNYTVVVLLTALDPKYECHLCRDFQPEYELLSKSWLAQQKGNNGLYFTVLDFAKGRETFIKLGLNTAPNLYMFPPTEGPDAKPAYASTPAKFDFTQSQIPAESVARWIATHTSSKITVKRPYDYTPILTTIGAVGVAGTILKLAFNSLKPALYSRNLWSAVSLILILLFTSGHMFNHIRSVPYIANNPKGGISYVAGGFSNQFGLETQIVAVTYAVLAFCSISLSMKMPRVADPTKQKVAIWLWSGVMLCAFSFLLNLFRMKNGSYPFKLPPLV